MKITRLTASIILFSVLAGMGLSSGEELGSTPVYLLDDCLRMAYKNNTVILKARQEIEVASGKKLQALSEAIPHLTGEAGYTYLNTINSYETEEGELPGDFHRAGSGNRPYLPDAGGHPGVIPLSDHDHALASPGHSRGLSGPIFN